MNNHKFKHKSANPVCSTNVTPKPKLEVQAQMTEHGMLVWMGNEIYFIPDWADEAWPLSKLYSAEMARRKYMELFRDRHGRGNI